MPQAEIWTGYYTSTWTACEIRLHHDRAVMNMLHVASHWGVALLDTSHWCERSSLQINRAMSEVLKCSIAQTPRVLRLATSTESCHC